MLTDQPGLRLGASERREQLLAAARATFGTNGFSATSMNDVALAAGVTKPVLYQHFESKHHLFLEVLSDTSAGLVTQIEGAVAQANSGREELESGFKAFVDFFADDPHNFRIIYGEGVRSDPTFLAELRELQASFGAFTAEHIDVDELDHDSRLLAAQAIAGLLESSMRQWLESGKPTSSEELTALLTSLAWRGLRGISAS